jgi:PKD repeat protein
VAILITGRSFRVRFHAMRVLATLSTTGLLVLGLQAPSALADTAPAVGLPATVSADALPTWQINGVVWAQVVVGNTVYVTGRFSEARPPGVAAGGNGSIAANNMFAYDVRTGNPVSLFSHQLNGQGLGIAASPDGSRVYVVGDFTTVDGFVRSHIAAFDTASNSLSTTFAPTLSSSASAVTATNTTVWAGGGFGQANGKGRSSTAAFTSSNGAILPWAPVVTGGKVSAMVLTPDKSRVILGGQLTQINGVSAYGMGSVDAVSGATMPWAANQTIQDAYPNGAIDTLAVDGGQIYGAGYAYGTGSSFEGAFAADPYTGNINWLNDCHGDTYGVFPIGQVLYTVSHVHSCQWIGGFANTSPTWTLHHAAAFTTYATGTNTGPDDYGWNYNGLPDSSLLTWYPTLAIGQVTGQNQAAWSVSGNSQYVVMGGEFPSVNNVAQQGLTRFAISSIAPNKRGPVSTSVTAPSAVSFMSGVARIGWQAAWDQDNTTLTYDLLRDNSATPIYSVTQDSSFWQLPSMGFIDTGLTPGSSHTYKIQVVDPFNNKVVSAATSVTISSAVLSHYASDILADGASNYWRLDEPSGSTANDFAGYKPLTEGVGVGAGAAGAVIGDSDAAATFDGTANGEANTTSAVVGPNTFSVEAWVNTTSTSGGKIVGFGDGLTGPSNNYDRHIYMDNAGHVIFGVYNNGTDTVQTAGTYNDGQYHQVVGTMSAAGMILFVDGKKVGTNGNNAGQAYSGYWHVGGDNLGGWPSQPTSNYLAGTIDDVSVFPTALSLSQVQKHFTDSGRSLGIAPMPTDAYGKAVYSTSPDIFWRLDDTTGTKALDASPNLSNGTYSGGYTLGASSTVSGAPGTAVTFDGSSGTIGSNNTFSNPTVYTESVWFNTTTTHGGKLIGFGSSQSGNSNSYDRHVYMLNNGQLVFGTYTGQFNLAQTSASYNDGQWHQAVATQGPDGMTLYVDGKAVATNPQTQAQAYTGYWRVGGDSDWGGDSPYFAGTIDEVAVYASTEFSAGQVQTIYNASPAAIVPPVAVIGSSCTNLICNFDGSGSTAPSGTVASYSWNFGDPANSTSNSAMPSFTYLAGGTYVASLTVTDNRGASTTVTKNVTVAANQPPVAIISPLTCSILTCAFDGSTSYDPDGTVASYGWSFGDNVGTSALAKLSYTYAAAGTYTVTLTVTDNSGVPTSTTTTVTVKANQPPVAVIATPSCTNLVCGFDGSGSSDPDGTVASYAWSFGDNVGTSALAKPSYTYAAAGTYTVTLTVTDNFGVTNTVTKSVTVTSLLAQDSFTRNVAAGWGTADMGGPWTTSNAANFSVGGGVGSLKMATAGSGPSIFLNGVSSTKTDVQVTVTTDKAATGGGIYLYVVGRRVTGTGDYRVKVHLLASGAVGLSVIRTSSTGAETALISEATVVGLTYAPGTALRIRLQVTGVSPTTVRAKVWLLAGTEPTAWAATATDVTAGLQVAGSVGLMGYLSGTATNSPVVAKFDDFQAGPSN